MAANVEVMTTTTRGDAVTLIVGVTLGVIVGDKAVGDAVTTVRVATGAVVGESVGISAGVVVMTAVAVTVTVPVTVAVLFAGPLRPGCGKMGGGVRGDCATPGVAQFASTIKARVSSVKLLKMTRDNIILSVAQRTNGNQVFADSARMVTGSGAV